MFNYRFPENDNLEYVTVALRQELPEGARLRLVIDRQGIALFNLAGGLYAIADVCSHDDGPLADGPLDGREIECPRHGARFDLASGKALSLPAVVDIPAYPVRLVGDEVQIGLPPA
jgi:3-phenylpropionate/trans-cinnamate dioxygenase ferredoxin subunit